MIASEKTAVRVFDAFPFLVLARKQNGWQIVQDKVYAAADANERHLVSLVNLGEAYYMLLREEGEETAERFLEGVLASAFDVVIPTIEQMKLAGWHKARGGLSYADSFAAALAKEYDVPILTGDPEFRNVEQHGVKIDWLPTNR
jgi:predicted nucleic acid-binding protein